MFNKISKESIITQGNLYRNVKYRVIPETFVRGCYAILTKDTLYLFGKDGRKDDYIKD